MNEVTFLGAAGVVTGSCTHLALEGRALLVDCGMYQGGDDLNRRNRAPFAFDAAKLDGVLLTHGHLDHSGLLPRLVAAGFRGPIFCSTASRAVTALILQDAGEIQEEEARFARRERYSRHRDPRPLYTLEDARRAIQVLRPIAFDKAQELFPGISVRFRRAGHLLGAASIEVTTTARGGPARTWCFSGDVGRYDVPILHDPQPPMAEPAALVLESTYGDRAHSKQDPLDGLRAAVRRVFDRGGVLVIPSFALGRAQDLLYYLSRLADEGVLAARQIALDSPMALDATRLYDVAHSEHDEEMEELERANEDPLARGAFMPIRTVNESKALNAHRGPLVIVASSGMATGGRVVHHLKQRLPDPRNAVLFPGFQAAGTRGRALVEGADVVAIHGRQVEVRAEIIALPGLSAHADRQELLRWCQALPAPPDRIFLNHGEDPARKALAAAIAGMGWPQPELPISGQVVGL
jgi:metallo-beta-lactamase family protein